MIPCGDDEKEDRIGLVLEGGGMRGMYTAGVLDVLMEKNICLDGVIGVSAGAIHGCNYVSGQIGRSVRYNLKYINDKRYMSLESLIKTGNLFNKEFCYSQVPDKLSPFDYDTFLEREATIPFYVTCTNLETGKAEYIRCRDFKKDMDFMRASASLPLLSEIVEADGMKLLDGGTCDSIPVDYFRSIGYGKNIVVLTRPEGCRKKPDRAIALIKLVYKDYPNYVKACEERYIKYNQTLDKLEEYEKRGEVLIIRPTRHIKISRVEKNTDKLKYIYKMGRHDTGILLEKIISFVQ